MSAARCVRIAATFLGRVDLLAQGADGGSEPRGRAARITDNECARQEHPARSRAGAGNLLEQKLRGGAAELVQGLGDGRQPRSEHVRPREVIEADQGQVAWDS